MLTLGSAGDKLEAYVTKLGWTLNSSVISIPPNPDNQIESVVVQENIKLPRKLTLSMLRPHTNLRIYLQSLSGLLHTLHRPYSYTFCMSRNGKNLASYSFPCTLHTHRPKGSNSAPNCHDASNTQYHTIKCSTATGEDNSCQDGSNNTQHEG